MGLGFSRKIISSRNTLFLKIKKIAPKLYYFLLKFLTRCKFFYKINKKKSKVFFSQNLDEINKYEYKKTSQNNEDGIFEYLINKLRLKELNFIEIGFDYYENNSINFLKKTNKGLFIDSSQDKVMIFKNITSFFYKKKKIFFKNCFVNKDNINEIISEYFTNKDEIDILSIDVDGVDYYILENLKTRPKILCIEYNFWFGNELKCSIPYSENFKWEIGSPYSGASLNAICSLASSKDYHLVALESSSVNAFFIRGDLKDKFSILDPKKNFKNPIRYDIDKIENTRSELLKKELVFFN